MILLFQIYTNSSPYEYELISILLYLYINLYSIIFKFYLFMIFQKIDTTTIKAYFKYYNNFQQDK